jgi:hypothetical protein
MRIVLAAQVIQKSDLADRWAKAPPETIGSQGSHEQREGEAQKALVGISFPGARLEHMNVGIRIGGMRSISGVLAKPRLLKFWRSTDGDDVPTTSTCYIRNALQCFEQRVSMLSPPSFL